MQAWYLLFIIFLQTSLYSEFRDMIGPSVGGRGRGGWVGSLPKFPKCYHVDPSLDCNICQIRSFNAFGHAPDPWYIHQISMFVTHIVSLY